VTVRLRGRVAAITGASSGIGEACARAFAEAGIAVSLCARRADRLAALAADVTAAGGRALPVAADVAAEDDVRAFVTRTLATFGRLDIVVCNAGFGYHGGLEDTAPDVMARLLAVNFLGTFHAARAALPYFEQQGGGHLVIVSSIVGRRGLPGYEGYSASKFAQTGLAEALRARYAGTGIHVSSVYPVSTRTEFREAMARDYGTRLSGHGPQQDAAQVARAILRCLERPRAEVYPYRWARALVWLSALAPGTTDRVVRRFARRAGAEVT
jgi:NAD(P)-dependent dehydrogenase (short-subunit alcohol dehydrogenase family)